MLRKGTLVNWHVWERTGRMERHSPGAPTHVSGADEPRYCDSGMSTRYGGYPCEYHISKARVNAKESKVRLENEIR